MKKIPRLLILLSATLSGLLLVKNKAPKGFIMWFPKLLAGALAPWNALLGAFAGLLAWFSGDRWAGLLGSLSAFLSARYLFLVTRPHQQFEHAFDHNWQAKLTPAQRVHMLTQRWTWHVPKQTGPVVERDLVFWTLAEPQERKLLCDIWLPPDGTKPSGLALLYFHGSAWYLLDKGFGTDWFFSRLAAQGHHVMDVAYRLFPETGMAGMLGDVKRAIAWMKANADRYGIDPERIVLGGGSAGGHLALLAAYAPAEPDLIPAELAGQDLSVRAVISEYGPVDLEACYFHTNQDQSSKETSPEPPQLPPPPTPSGNPRKDQWAAGFHRLGLDKPSDTGSFVKILGGQPHEIPEVYCKFSPIAYARADCPPTLLIQGEDDLITPVTATQTFYQNLVDCGVQVVNVIFPQTDHAFDLMLPSISPTAQAALYDIERFLALMV